MDTIVLVHLTLMHPNPSKEADGGLTVDLCFNDEPTAEALFEAFQEVPTVQKHLQFEIYRRRLFECLETYGIPKLDKFSMVTPEGAPIAVPAVYATWHLNLVAPTGAALGVRIGDIRISRRQVHRVDSAVHDPELDFENVENDEQPRRVVSPQPNPSQTTKAKKLTGVRKARVR